ILSFVFMCVMATLILSLRITPIYESTATLDIDRAMPTAAVGQDAARTVLPNTDADQYLATQINLIQSDSVVRPVVEQLHLKDKDAEFRESVKNAASEDAPVKLTKLKVTRPPNT